VSRKHEVKITVYGLCSSSTCESREMVHVSTGSALAAASDIRRQVPTYMADIRRDWLTNQNTDWCFVVIGLVGRQSHSPLLQLKIDPVSQMCPPSLLASEEGQRIFINIRGQYGIPKNIYIHPCYEFFVEKIVLRIFNYILVPTFCYCNSEPSQHS